jgi:hypothetical protein
VLCFAASKQVPEFETNEESFELPKQRVNQQEVLCVK